MNDAGNFTHDAANTPFILLLNQILHLAHDPFLHSTSLPMTIIANCFISSLRNPSTVLKLTIRTLALETF